MTASAKGLFRATGNKSRPTVRMLDGELQRVDDALEREADDFYPTPPDRRNSERSRAPYRPDGESPPSTSGRDEYAREALALSRRRRERRDREEEPMHACGNDGPEPPNDTVDSAPIRATGARMPQSNPGIRADRRKEDSLG